MCRVVSLQHLCCCAAGAWGFCGTRQAKIVPCNLLGLSCFHAWDRNILKGMGAAACIKERNRS